MLDQHPLQPEHQTWWQMLWASPGVLLLFLVKSFREWVRERIQNAFKPKENRVDVITRDEFEAHHSELKDHFREGMTELKSDIHDIRTDVKETGRDLFNKMDNFLAVLTSRVK